MFAANVPHDKNEVHLAGVLAKEPTVRVTPTGKKVANLTVATRFKDNSQYHRVVCWENLAEKVERLTKGEFVKVVGRLEYHAWEDATKTKRYTTEVIAFQVVVPGKEPVTISTTGLEVTDEDIPF
jgi:single-strand DNA-binding protein